jgi:hypothetical protein
MNHSGWCYSAEWHHAGSNSAECIKPNVYILGVVQPSVIECHPVLCILLCSLWKLQAKDTLPVVKIKWQPKQ